MSFVLRLIKQCLVAWLPSLLQLDPAKRGKYVITSEEAKTGKGEICALSRLRNILNTKFLQIHTLTDRIVFAIGKSTKISEVQLWISRTTGIHPDDQIILTVDGVGAQPNELAIKYMEVMNYFKLQIS